MWRFLRRVFGACCGRCQEGDEGAAEDSKAAGTAPPGPAAPVDLEWLLYLRDFYSTYNAVADELSLNSSGERELFLEECMKMQCRVLESQLATSGGDAAVPPPAATTPATPTPPLPPPPSQGRRRRHRRVPLPAAPGSSSSDESDAPPARWRPQRRLRRRKLRTGRHFRSVAAVAPTSSSSASSPEEL